MSDTSWIPDNTNPLVFEKFAGLNTKASRNGIKNEEMFTCDGWMPLGENNLRTMPGINPVPLYTAPAGLTIFWYAFGNIQNTPLCIVVLSDGSIVAVRVVVSIGTQIAPPGTIIPAVISGGTTQLGLTQWGAQFIVLVALQPNGFFVFDGNNLYTNGTLGPDVELFQSGLGYTSSPTITTIGGSGSGATFAATIFEGGVQQISVTNPGIGFLSTDQVILAFSGGGSPGITANLKPLVNTGGTITSVSIVTPGATYQNPVGTVLDSSGIGALLSIIATGGSITTVSVVNGGEDYSTSAQILVEDPNSPLVVATVDLFPSGISGSTAEVFTSRLFIGNIAQILISAPGSIVDFAAADGGDEFTSNDSFLRQNFSFLKQSNGFIYLVADSSVNYISSIQTSGSPPATTFSNQNADPENGTPWPTTGGTFGESVIFANSIGVQLGYGGSFVKISEQLDGFYFTGVNDLPSFTPSAAKAIVFGRKIWAMLININTLQFPNQNKLVITDGKIWWTSSQDMNLTYIAGQEIQSVLTAFGTDGNSIHQLFAQPSTGFVKTVESKLWDQPGGYLVEKTINRVYGAAMWNVLLAVTGLTIAAETELTGFFPPTATFQPSGGGVTVFPATAISAVGVLAGMTITTSDADVTLISATLSVGVDNYRG